MAAGARVGVRMAGDKSAWLRMAAHPPPLTENVVVVVLRKQKGDDVVRFDDFASASAYLSRASRLPYRWPPSCPGLCTHLHGVAGN